MWICTVFPYCAIRRGCDSYLIRFRPFQCLPEVYCGARPQTCHDVQECEQCPNVKLVEDTVKLSFDIEPGMDTGHVITLSEEGEPHADGDSGDLNIIMVSEPHPFFHREKNNLKIKADITLVDALVGFERTIEHLDGHKVRFFAGLCIRHAFFLPQLWQLWFR